jgi:hypothetical protein
MIKDASYFYYGIAPIQKAWTFLNRTMAAFISILLYCIAFLFEKIGLWPKATKGDLLLLFEKKNLPPLGLGKTILITKWETLSQEEKTGWRLFARQAFNKKSLRSSPDTYRVTKEIDLWNL